VDVRRFPGSRRNPQFSQDELKTALQAVSIEYLWLGESLGGHRKPDPDSPNRALRNTSFRGYADHMRSESYRAGLDELIRRSQSQCVAIMCAERLPWRCHRSLIADSLVSRGISVRDLIGLSEARSHRLHPAARVENSLPVYDVGAPGDLL
jgi:uncharacterized protein (DUF488 family)